MLDKLSRTVSCSFARTTRANGFELDQVDVQVATGARVAWLLSDACEAHAERFGWQLWAVPVIAPRVTGAWRVFEASRKGRSDLGPDLLKQLPTREAAEMWMAHRDGD